MTGNGQAHGKAPTAREQDGLVIGASVTADRTPYGNVAMVLVIHAAGRLSHRCGISPRLRGGN